MPLCDSGATHRPWGEDPCNSRLRRYQDNLSILDRIATPLPPIDLSSKFPGICSLAKWVSPKYRFDSTCGKIVETKELAPEVGSGVYFDLFSCLYFKNSSWSIVTMQSIYR